MIWKTPAATALPWALAEHFLARYAHLSGVDVEVREKLWTRMAPVGRPHPFSFVRDSNGQPFSKVRAERGQSIQRSAGIRGLSS